MAKQIFVVLCCICIAFTTYSQKQTSRSEYISQYADLAMKEMQRTGIPASITLAQACLESADGNSDLALAAQNHFGIKCHSSWTGQKIYKDDDTKNECFRVYNSVYESYKDHSEFLQNGRRYAFLFELPATDYKAWAHGLQKAGYATNPKYAEHLIRIIEENKLYVYDQPEKYQITVTETQEKSGIASKFKFTRPPLTKAPAPTIAPPDISLLAPIETKFDKPIFEHNRAQFVQLQDNETIFTISQKFGIPVWKLFYYNDFVPGQSLTNGDIVYIEHKRNQAEKPHYTHTVQTGETLFSISQLYGIKVSRLASMNRLNPEELLEVGTHIYVRKNLIMFE